MINRNIRKKVLPTETTNIRALLGLQPILGCNPTITPSKAHFSFTNLITQDPWIRDCRDYNPTLVVDLAFL